MRTLGYFARTVRRRAFRARMCSTRAGSSATALSSASASEQASATVGGAAAVNGGALAAMDERLQRKAAPLDQHTNAVQPVELVGGQAQGVDALKS